jgi:hypothetical protein
VGGCGSTRWLCHTRKRTVEECFSLSIDKLVRDGMLLAGIQGHGGLTWTNKATGVETASASYDVDTLDSADPCICLGYTLTHTGQATRQTIQLTTTPLPWGGIKWWFICPRCSPAGGNTLRRRKLYRPPGAIHFGCRRCYDLTYASSQEAHRFDRLLRQLPNPLGLPIRELQDTFREH